jgi:signal peptidase I
MLRIVGAWPAGTGRADRTALREHTIRDSRTSRSTDVIPREAFVLVPIVAYFAAALVLRPRPLPRAASAMQPKTPAEPPQLEAPCLAAPTSAMAPEMSTPVELHTSLRRAYAMHSIGRESRRGWRAPLRVLDGWTQTPRLLGVAMVLWFAAAYLWQYRLGGQLWPTFRGTYAAGPYLWTVCAAVAFAAWRSTRRPAHETNAVPLAFVAGAFTVSVTVVAGMVAGIGHSPYAHSPYWLLANTFYVGAPLCAFEFGRAYVIRTFGQRVTPAIALTALGATLLGFSYQRLIAWEGPHPEVIFVSSRFLPDLASNLLASFLVYRSGPFAGIVYRGVFAAYKWYSPYVADVPWLATSCIGIATPVVGLLILEGLHVRRRGEGRDQPSRRRAASTAWALTATASLAMLWTTFGFFGVRPSFIPGNSMEPTIDPGSIAVTKVVSPDAVQVGDVVMYRRGPAHVLRRVVEKRPDGMFIFKGDHESTPDPDPVPAEEIEGRLVIDVPYAGWVPIWASRVVQRVSGH